MITCTLDQVRKRRKLSLYRLRQLSGVTYPTLWAMAHNKTRMFRADVLDKLCRALKCQPGDLLQRKTTLSQPKRRYPR
jgi:putative transcriptional regulator